MIQKRERKALGVGRHEATQGYTKREVVATVIWPIWADCEGYTWSPAVTSPFATLRLPQRSCCIQPSVILLYHPLQLPSLAAVLRYMHITHLTHLFLAIQKK